MNIAKCKTRAAGTNQRPRRRNYSGDIMTDEIENIAERGICYCGNPNLLWQPRRNLFRCGWCGHDFEITEALKLTRLTEQQYKKVNLVYS